MGCCASQPTPVNDGKSTQGNNNQDSKPKDNELVSGKSKPHGYSPRQQPSDHANKNKISNQKPISQDPAKEPSSSISSINLSVEDNDRKSQFLEKIAVKKLELEAANRSLQELQNTVLENQVSKQREGGFVGLYQIFGKHASNANKTKMDMDGLTAALTTFGMIIDTKPTLQKFVFSKFDLDNEGEIDYNDFMATMSSLIGTKTEESLLLLFQIFDIDEDGYLNLEDMARVLLAQNQMAVVVTGQQDEVKIVYTKRQCLKQARRMIAQYDSDQFRDDKISFDEFHEMMMKLDTKDMMIDNMVQPSVSTVFGTPSVDKTSNYKYPSGQIQPSHGIVTDQTK